MRQWSFMRFARACACGLLLAFPTLACVRAPRIERVVLLGFDGVGPNLVEPLIEQGRLPALRRVMNEGAYGPLRSFAPTKSNILWTSVATGKTMPGRLLAMDSGIATGRIDGLPTKEPAFGLDAWWIEPALKARAETMNYTVVDAVSVLATHLTEVTKQHADELLSREEVNNLVATLKEKSPKLVEEVVPAMVKPGDLQKVLQNLLRERVPIRDVHEHLD